MRVRAKLAIVVVCGFSLCGLWSQEKPKQSSPPRARVRNLDVKVDSGRTLSPDDRLSVIAAALDTRSHLHSEPDCSHLVHAIYQRAGFPYAYAPSSEIYAGVGAFERVKVPEPGDLVVWRGHAGIVIKPSQHVFFSFLNSGPGIDDYGAGYWKKRGHPRFYRYLKSDYCDGCAHGTHRVLKIKR
jgi:hypothetical protein